MPYLDEKLQEAIDNICTNHHKILDDWCKAYLSEIYELGLELKPGCFVLNQMQVNEEGKIGWKYWFTLKENNMNEAALKSTIQDMFESACEIIMKDNIDDIEFELCLNTIHTTLTYLKGKRNFQSCDGLVPRNRFTKMPC